MSGVPVPRLRGLAHALQVIESAERTVRLLAGRVEGALGTESPIAKELRSLSLRLDNSIGLVKSDMEADDT